MKLAFSTLGCPEYDLEQVIEAAREYGYQGIGIRTVRGESYLPNLKEFQPKGIEETHRKLNRAGLEVVCVSSGIRFESLDAQEREKQLRDAEKYVDIAVHLEAPFIRVFGGPLPKEQDHEETMRHIVNGLYKTAEIGSKKGIKVLLETHDSFSTGKACRELLSQIGHQNLAVLWDILHPYRCGEKPEETLILIGDLIRHVHIKDSSNYSPESFNIKLCGEGTLPIRECVALLRKRGYDGYLSFEWEKGWHPEIPPAAEAFPHYVNYMKNQVLQG